MPKEPDKFEERMATLFSDNPPPEETPTNEDPVVEETTEEEVVEEEVQEEEVVVEESATDEEEDYDASHKKEEPEEEVLDESKAQQEAKRRGKEAKELKATLKERELEIERERTEKAELKARLEEIEATKLAPEDHEDYKSGRDAILSDVRGSARRLTGDAKTLLPNLFGKLMASYLASSDVAPENVVEEDEKLAGEIITNLKLSEIPYADLEPDERAALQPTIDKVLDVLERNAGKTKELSKLHASLTEKAKVGQLSVGVRQYESTAKEFKSVLDTVGIVAEDLIDSNPYAVESVVAKLAKSSPEAAKRLEKARADVLEVIVGPRALTQKEIDTEEAKGTNIKEFLAERAKLHRQKQLKMAAMFTQGLMTRSLLKESLAKLAKYEAKEEGVESELDAIRKTTKKTAKPAKEKPAAWTVDNLFSGD